MLNSCTIKLNIKIMLLACTKNLKLRDKVLVKITFWLANYKHIQCILLKAICDHGQCSSCKFMATCRKSLYYKLR